MEATSCARRFRLRGTPPLVGEVHPLQGVMIEQHHVAQPVGDVRIPSPNEETHHSSDYMGTRAPAPSAHSRLPVH